MRRRLFAVGLVGLLCVLLLGSRSALAYSGAGSGTENSPYIITSCDDLQSINDDVDAYYMLGVDLNCSDWNEGTDWASIGSFDNKFSGTLDGDGHTISGIHAEHDPGDAKFGLFSFVQNATIKDITVGGSIINTSDNLGICMGSLAQGSFGNLTLTNVVSNMNISANVQSTAGGFIGCVSYDAADNVTISGSTVNATISGASGGGLLGDVYINAGGKLNITDSHTSGNISCDFLCGGLVGYHYDEWDGEHDRLALTITSTTSNMTIQTENGDSGGFVGRLVANGLDADITSSTFTGSITTEADNSGGFIGRISSNGHSPNINIDKSFTAATITSDSSNIGGFVGKSGEDLSTNITRSFTQLAVSSAGNYQGGLIGNAGETSITDSYADVSLSGGTYIGGLVGGGSDITIGRSYSSGVIGSTETVIGGLVGGAETANISDSFSATSITSSTPTTVSGLIGAMASGGVTNSYVDSTKSTQGCITTYGVDATVTEFSCDNISDPNYFKNNSSNSPLNTWGFPGTWGTYEEYPCLSWRIGCINGDFDGDGIASSEEQAGPNSGDANDDGTPDMSQANVAGFINFITGKYQVIETDCDSLSAVQVGREAGDSHADSSYDYPMGLSSFHVNCNQPGVTARISQLFFDHPGSDKYVLRKWSSGNYGTIQGYELRGQLIDGKTVFRVNYEITDGQMYDEDGQENAVIVDPAGLGLPIAATGSNVTLASTGDDTRTFFLSCIGLIVVASAAAVVLNRKKTTYSSR